MKLFLQLNQIIYTILKYKKIIWENIDNSSNSELELLFSIIAFEIWLKKFKVIL